MKYFHNEFANRGVLSITFNFDYMDAKRRVPDPQPKLQARYRSVVSEVVARYHPKTLIIGGKSMGGRVASYIAHDMPELAGLLFLGYPLHPPGKPAELRDQHLYELKIPMLFVSGTRDTFAESKLLDRVVQKIGTAATLVWIEGGDHSLQRRKGDTESFQLAADAIMTWISRL